MYTLYKFENGYSVTWDDPEIGTVVQDREEGEIYKFSGWVEEPLDIIGKYDTLNDAWWAACIDPYMAVYGDIRMHPQYSYKLKGVAE